MMKASSQNGLAASPNLLGIPRELRYEIYDHLRLEDYNHTILKFSQRWWSEDVGNVQPLTNVNISWYSLLRTCRALHNEITHHITAESPTSQSELHTVKLELDCGTSQIHRVILHRVPCPPPQIRQIFVHMNARSIKGMRTRGDGGVCPNLRHMFHTLRRLLQNGPLLDDPRPLASPMPIRDLVVEYDLGDKLVQADEENLKARREGGDPRHVFLSDGHMSGYDEVIMFAKSLVNTGVLSGYMDRIIVKNKFFGEESIAVPLVTGGYSIPDYWEHAGFWWTKPLK